MIAYSLLGLDLNDWGILGQTGPFSCLTTSLIHTSDSDAAPINPLNIQLLQLREEFLCSLSKAMLSVQEPGNRFRPGVLLEKIGGLCISDNRVFVLLREVPNQLGTVELLNFFLVLFKEFKSARVEFNIP